jgi:protein phosphatase
MLAEIEHSGLSLTGPVRQDNQDAIRLPEDGQILAADRGLLYALADGMGGYAHGDVAATVALDTLYQKFGAGEIIMPVRKHLQRSVEAANLEVYQTAQRLGAGRMGTTLTAATVLRQTLLLAHVGDSRAYLVRAGRAVCLTNDHTTVGDLVRMRLLTPEKVRGHAQRSILNKALGLGLFVQPDIVEVGLQDDDRLILCSDGVWSVVEDDEMARLATQAPAARLSEDLLSLALERETDDNCSAIAVHVKRLAPGVAAGPSPGHNWLTTLRKRLSPNGRPW